MATNNWQFLGGADDVKWLLETHLRDSGLTQDSMGSFILNGNEDYPKEIICYGLENPRMGDTPVARFMRSRRARGNAYYRVDGE